MHFLLHSRDTQPPEQVANRLPAYTPVPDPYVPVIPTHPGSHSEHKPSLGTAGEKIKLKTVACFSAPKNTPSPHHIYHAFHHNFTTKKPHPKHAFPQNPPQKRPLNRGRPSATTPKL